MNEPPNKMPTHVAIIMDGNGRWAQKRGLPRTEGHMSGAESADKVVRRCADLGIPLLTLFAFSTENWKRPKSEVRFLMSQLRKFLRERRDEFVETGVRLKVIGEVGGLPVGVQRELARTMKVTAANEAMTLVLALNYGSHREIAQAARRIAEDVQSGRLVPEEVDEDAVAARLYTAGMPDPDLLIRTAGEKRISNFLLWQLSYTELYVTDTLWPDFDEGELMLALQDYGHRHRRFGAVPDAAPVPSEDAQ